MNVHRSEDQDSHGDGSMGRAIQGARGKEKGKREGTLYNSG